MGHTHHDVGYPNGPRVVADLHDATVRRVLDLCDTNDEDRSTTTAEPPASRTSSTRSQMCSTTTRLLP